MLFSSHLFIDEIFAFHPFCRDIRSIHYEPSHKVSASRAEIDNSPFDPSQPTGSRPPLAIGADAHLGSKSSRSSTRPALTPTPIKVSTSGSSSTPASTAVNPDQNVESSLDRKGKSKSQYATTAAFDEDPNGDDGADTVHSGLGVVSSVFDADGRDIKRSWGSSTVRLKPQTTISYWEITEYVLIFHFFTSHFHIVTSLTSSPHLTWH